jgi:hypothetical protein
VGAGATRLTHPVTDPMTGRHGNRCTPSRLLQQSARRVQSCAMSLLLTHEPEAIAMQRWLRFHARLRFEKGGSYERLRISRTA